MKEETDALFMAERWLGEGRGVALGTVIATWGSAPRPAGSQITIRDDGAFVGSVSGGCVEGAVIEAGLGAIRDGMYRKLEFGVQDDQALSVGLACGGKIEILVEPVTSEKARQTVAKINAKRRQEEAVVRAIDLTSGRDQVLESGELSTLGIAAAEAIRTDRSAQVECDGRPWFLTLYNPPVDLVIVGAVHIAQALVKMADLLGYRIRVIDPRSSFATADRFPGISLSHDYPDDALAKAPLGRRSALVTLAHDPKIDDPALVAALQSEAFYVGALGSKKTQASRQERLKARGFSEEKLARLHGPVGLAIGAKTPEEIALSIVAEMTEVLRKP